jgi:hypothetical protein
MLTMDLDGGSRQHEYGLGYMVPSRVRIRVERILSNVSGVIVHLQALKGSIAEDEVSSISRPSAESEDGDEEDAARHSVHRRYSHFDQLQRALSTRYPILALPPLPPKAVSSGMDERFLEQRRHGLERWLRRIARHPVLCRCHLFKAFLEAENNAVFLIPSPSAERR